MRWRSPMSSRLRIFAVGLLAWVLVVASPHGQAGAPAPQFSGVTIEGTVVDASRAALPGVTVTLEQSNKVISTATTDSGGKFRFAGIPIGTYEVRAALAG